MFKGPIPRGLFINLFTLLILEGSFGGFGSNRWVLIKSLLVGLHHTMSLYSFSIIRLWVGWGGCGAGFQTASTIIIKLDSYMRNPGGNVWLNPVRSWEGC